MIPITRDEIKLLIQEGREAGKDVSELENLDTKLNNGGALPSGEYHHLKVLDKDKGFIYSTGPARESDFE